MSSTVCPSSSAGLLLAPYIRDKGTSVFRSSSPTSRRLHGTENRENHHLAHSLRPVFGRAHSCGLGVKQDGEGDFRLIQKHFRGTFRKIQHRTMPRTSAKAHKQKTPLTQAKISLDTVSETLRKGRPRKIQPGWVRGRADNYRKTFDLFWQHVWPNLSKAQTQQDVIQSFARPEVGSYALDLIRLADLILQVVRDPKFPKHKREAQINFLSDSIAAYGVVTPRSSRDICERERARANQVHRIVCYEFYIECSCGYTGHSLHHACPICGAEIQFNTNSTVDADFDS